MKIASHPAGEYHFVSEKVSDEDIDMFFGPVDKADIFVVIEERWIMAHLLHKIGLFPSVSQARKNGWNKPIPEGFNFYNVGKKQRKQTFYILNIQEKDLKDESAAEELHQEESH